MTEKTEPPSAEKIEYVKPSLAQFSFGEVVRGETEECEMRFDDPELSIWYCAKLNSESED